MVLRLSTFPTDVANTVLSAFSTASSAVVTAASTVVQAIGQLQAQVTLRTVNASAAITGGTINGATIGATTPSTGAFTGVNSSGNVLVSGTARVAVGGNSTNALWNNGQDACTFFYNNLMASSWQGFGLTCSVGFLPGSGVFTTEGKTFSHWLNARNGDFHMLGNLTTLGAKANINAAQISSSGAVTTLDIVGKRAALTSSTPVSGGTSGYTTSDCLTDASGNIYAPTTVVSGVITVINLTLNPYITGTTPSNPVTLTAQSGVGVGTVTVNLTWTTVTSLVINPTGASTTISGANVTSGTINNTTLGATTPAAGTFTALNCLTGNVLNTTGRNLVQNGMFNIQQRGAGPWTTNAFTADRWGLNMVGDTNSATILTLADIDRSLVQSEYAQYALQDVVTGSATAANYSILSHKIEDVRRLSNTTVTISFWVQASAALNVGVSLQQNFGSGGSAGVVVGTATVPATAFWGRFTVTATLPSTAGKTFGTGHNTQLIFALSSGATNATSLGVGVQSGTFEFWGVQVEIGSAYTPNEIRPIGQELALCQRFYTFLSQSLSPGYGVASATQYNEHILPVTMRASPSVTFANVTYTNASALALNGANVGLIRTQNAVTATGQYWVAHDILAAADL